MLGATTAAAGAAAATGYKIGDFGVGDALALARDVRRGPLILTLDLTRPLRSEESNGLSAWRTRGRPTLREVIEAVLQAAEDDRVVALVGHVGGAVGGLATVQELVGAIAVFTASGKPSVAHCAAFGGEGGNGTLDYLLATAFGEIHLQPTGDLALLGVASEVTFLRSALDKAGIEPQFGHRHEYKNAADQFTERDFTPAHREALGAVVDSWSTQIVTAVATARRLDADVVRQAVDDAPLPAGEAAGRGLIDRIAYRDETLDDVRARVAPGAELLALPDYRSTSRARQRWHARRAPVVALIEAHGGITQTRRSDTMGSSGITADVLGAALRRAAQDDDIAAVLLRVDSPGGSAVASDTIRRAILTTRRAGTPVVAWMGDVAGSGGYYIAMAADQIVAQPGTLTGSIGVVGGKAVTDKLERRLGLETHAIVSGANARFFSRTAGFDDEQRMRLEGWLDRVYDDFTARVAEDRGLTRERVHQLARGRIWTGAQAHERGLVDRLGGYADALGAVRATLGLDAGAPVRLRSYPPQPSLADRLRGKGVDDPAEQQLAVLTAALSGDAGTLRAAVHGLLQPSGVLAMPFVPRLR
jgi:protease-4